MSTPRAQILVSKPFSNKNNQVSLQKWLILGLGQKIHKTRLEHLVVPETKEVLKMKQNQETTNDGNMFKGHRSQMKELPMAKAGKI